MEDGITEFAVRVFVVIARICKAQACKFVAIQNLKFKGKIALKFAKLLTNLSTRHCFLRTLFKSLNFCYLHSAFSIWLFKDESF